MKRIFMFMTPSPPPADPSPTLHRRAFLTALAAGVAATTAASAALAGPAAVLPSPADFDGVATDFARRIRIRWRRRRRGYRRWRSRRYGRRSRLRSWRSYPPQSPAGAATPPGGPMQRSAPIPAPAPTRPPRIRFN